MFTDFLISNCMYNACTLPNSLQLPFIIFLFKSNFGYSLILESTFCFDFQIMVMDLRTVSFDVPPQEILTRDSVTVAVDAVVYYRLFWMRMMHNIYIYNCTRCQAQRLRTIASKVVSPLSSVAYVICARLSVITICFPLGQQI